MELQALQRKITWKRNKAWEGKEVEVLVEGRSKANAEENMGRTRTNHIVNFPGKTLASVRWCGLEFKRLMPTACGEKRFYD